MDETRLTCKRCSVHRVNTLCSLYDQAFRENLPEALKTIKAFVQLAGKRGYGEGSTVLQPGLSDSYVRKMCWNISSLLTDDDFKRMGLNGHGRGSSRS